MNKEFIRLQLFMLLALFSFSCRKGDVLEGSKVGQLYINYLFSENMPPIDLYINGKFNSKDTTGSGFVRVSFLWTDKITITLKKSGSTKTLIDTAINVTSEQVQMLYAYDPAIGFNRFIDGNEFERPSQDSMAFMFRNDYKNFGSGSIDLIIYKDPDGDFVYNLEDSVAAIKGVLFSEFSKRIVLPYKGDENYVMIVKDAKTGLNPLDEVTADLGLPLTYAAVSLVSGIFTETGKLNCIKITPQSLDAGTGKLYHIYKADLLFKY